MGGSSAVEGGNGVEIQIKHCVETAKLEFGKVRVLHEAGIYMMQTHAVRIQHSQSGDQLQTKQLLGF